MELLKAFKTEIKPTNEQALKIMQTIGICRYVYNLFISENKNRYEVGLSFLGGYSFSKWLSHEYLGQNPDKSWIKSASSKAVKQSIMNADKAFKAFFHGYTGYPRYKKKGKTDPGIYLPNGNLNQKLPLIQIERHRIKLPTFGWIRIKEKGYLPYRLNPKDIKSATITYKAGRYYVSVLANVEDPSKPILSDRGVGIDVGIKELAITSDGKFYPNINKSMRVKNIKKRLKRAQRRLSRKYESLKNRSKKSKKGEATRQNIHKQQRKVQVLYQKLANIRTDYINKCINELVKTKPAYITLEDLNVHGMLRNKYLSEAVSEQRLYTFRDRLIAKSRESGIEIRIVSRWYPSSKSCHKCGYIKRDLTLKDRIFQCPNCGHTLDRDLNAAMNLRNALEYSVAA